MSEELKKRKEALFSTKKNGYDRLDEAGVAAMEDYCRDYKDFLDAGKTERACAERAVASRVRIVVASVSVRTCTSS